MHLLTKWLQEKLFTLFSITWIFTPYNTCLPKRNVISSPHSVDRRESNQRKKKATRPCYCTPHSKYVTAASIVGEQPYFRCGCLPQDHIRCLSLNSLKGSGVFSNYKTKDSLKEKTKETYSALAENICVSPSSSLHASVGSQCVHLFGIVLSVGGPSCIQPLSGCCLAFPYNCKYCWSLPSFRSSRGICFKGDS